MIFVAQMVHMIRQRGNEMDKMLLIIFIMNMLDTRRDFELLPPDDNYSRREI